MIKSLILILFMLPCGQSQDRPGQVGDTPKQEIPKLIQQMQKESANPNSNVTSQLLKSNADIRRDHGIIALQLAAMSTQMAAMREELAKKDMSRVAVLETKLDTVIRDKAAAEVKQDKRDQAVINATWDITKWIVAPTLATIAGMLLSTYKSKKQKEQTELVKSMVEEQIAKIEQVKASVKDQAETTEKVRDSVDLVVDSLDHVNGKIQTLTDHTNGLSEKLVTLASNAGFHAGVKSEKEQAGR